MALVCRCSSSNKSDFFFFFIALKYTRKIRLAPTVAENSFSCLSSRGSHLNFLDLVILDVFCVFTTSRHFWLRFEPTQRLQVMLGDKYTFCKKKNKRKKQKKSLVVVCYLYTVTACHCKNQAENSVVNWNQFSDAPSCSASPSCLHASEQTAVHSETSWKLCGLCGLQGPAVRMDA